MASEPPADVPVNSVEADRFRNGILHVIGILGRDGVDHALETLFAISDPVLNTRYCDEHTMRRIREILADAQSSEEES